ncbi:MAG: hypothetical protein R3C16_05115 [Hyphomonadaceae bacterium]
MRRLLLLLVVLLGASTFAAGPSQAQFATCNQLYVDTFRVPAFEGNPEWSPGEIECVEFFRISFETPEGTRWIRGVGDINLAPLLTPGAIDGAREGARLSAQRMQALGEWSMDNTTILLTFSVADPAELSDVHDAAWKQGGPAAWTLPGQGVEEAECKVTLFLLNDWSADVDIPYMTAHELFHCVQMASLPETQAHAWGQWWVDGTAELFAALVVPDGTESWDRAPRFDRAVENERPLYAMHYEAAVFFYWLYQERGYDALMPFMRGMAHSAEDAAQRAAIRENVSDEEILAFAQAYLDGTINYPLRGPLRTTPPDGVTWSINASGAHSRVLKPFVIMPGYADYACGRWEGAPTAANAAVREESARDWGSWPGDVDARASGGTRYRTVAVHTDEGNAEFTLRIRRTASCAGCLAATVIDRCVVGTWQLTAGGPIEWMQRMGVPITRNNTSPIVLTMNEDGTFNSEGFGIDMQMTFAGRDGPTIYDARGAAQPTSGRWSAEGGRIQACFDGGGAASGVSTATTPEITVSSPFSGPGVGGEAGSTSYTCSDTTFFTSSPTPRGAMTHTFTRQTPRRD